MDNNFINLLFKQKVLPSPIKCFREVNIYEIAKTICAFLNEQGGWIVIGIDDKYNHTAFDELKVLKQIQYELANNIAPLPMVYIQNETFNGENVILITVLKGSLPPYSYKGKYYIYLNNKAKAPSPDQISILMRQSFSIKSNWESIVNLFASPNNLNQKFMDEVYSQGVSSHRLTESPQKLLSTLSELQLIDSYEVKNGAVCLFGNETNTSIPQCRVRIQMMRKGKIADTFDNTQILEGNILFLMKETMNYFIEVLPKQSFFIDKSPIRIDEYVYPMDVLREAIVNALIHRDYTDSIGEISIFIFSDRIEITNPGRLPDKLVKGKNEVMSHISILRNPLMAEIFYIGGYMEKTGRGMELISNRMKAIGKKLPEWTSTGDSTTLKIFNKPHVVLFNNRISAFLKDYSINDIFTKSEYINYFKSHPSKITAQTDISKMIEGGLCKKIGNGPSTRYQIIEQIIDR